MDSRHVFEIMDLKRITANLSGRGCSIKAEELEPTEENAGGRYRCLPGTIEHVFRRLFPEKHETSLEKDDEDDEGDKDEEGDEEDKVHDDYEAYDP